MPRPLALLMAVVALAGCRTPPPSMDPFLRTTVPPPGTAAGDPYYQSGGQPAATAPAAAPATVVPPPSKYAPPGGSFQYQQSSIDRPKAVTPGSGGLRLGSNWLTGGQAVKVPPPSTALSARATAVPNLPPEALSLPPAGSLGSIQTASTATPTTSAAPTAAATTIVAPPTNGFQPNVSATANASTQPAAGSTVQLANGTTLRAEPTLAKAAGEAGAATTAAPQVQLASAIQTSENSGVTTATFRESAGSTSSEPVSSGGDGGTVIRILTPRDSSDTTSSTSTTESTSSGEPLRMNVNEITNLPLASPAHRAASRATWVRSSERVGGSLPATSAAAASTPIVASAVQPVTVPAATSVTSADKYHFSPDYSSLRGRLEYSQSARQWKLRYIPIDGQTDRFGGSVVLPSSPLLEAFKPGDFVSISGSLTANASATRGFSPLYDLRQIEAAR